MFQFFPGSITKGYPDRADPRFLCAFHIILPVTDEDSIPAQAAHAELVQRFIDHIRFSRSGSVHFASDDHTEILLDPEIPQDLPAEFGRLRRRQRQHHTFPHQGVQKRNDAVIQPVFIDSPGAVPLPVRPDCPFGFFFGQVGIAHELFFERRSDKAVEIMQILNLDVELFPEGILNAAGNPFAGVCQRPIQIK